MGIGYYPESFFHGVIRGYRYTEKIINDLKPQKVILIDDKTPSFIGCKIAIDKFHDKMDFSFEYYKIDRIRELFDRIFSLCPTVTAMLMKIFPSKNINFCPNITF